MQAQEYLPCCFAISAVIAGAATEGSAYFGDLIAHQHLFQRDELTFDPGVTAGVRNEFDVELELGVKRFLI